MGHAFFTLSLGMGAIMIYGAYVPKGTSIAGTSVVIAIADTMVALIAGMAIFPIVFAHGLDPAAGPRLIFETVPVAFGNIAGGTFFGTLFFLLLLIAAWTSIHFVARTGRDHADGKFQDDPPTGRRVCRPRDMAPGLRHGVLL